MLQRYTQRNCGAVIIGSYVFYKEDYSQLQSLIVMCVKI